MQAPGYFSVVQRAMDFTTMRAKVQGDSYSAWQQFEVQLMPCHRPVLPLSLQACAIEVCSHASGSHTWLLLQDDMDVMFDNAMVYNTPDTVYYKQARSLKALAAKMVGLAKQGVTDFRLFCAAATCHC